MLTLCAPNRANLSSLAFTHTRNTQADQIQSRMLATAENPTHVPPMESHICNPLNLQVADKSDDHNGYIVDEPLDAAIVADVVQEQV